MRAGGHAFRGLARRETGADREPAAKPLGQRDNVGRDAGVLTGQKFAGAADAALHFVEHQQQSTRVAERAHPTQKIPEQAQAARRRFRA